MVRFNTTQKTQSSTLNTHTGSLQTLIPEMILEVIPAVPGAMINTFATCTIYLNVVTGFGSEDS